jgi:hypothetical protein
MKESQILKAAAIIENRNRLNNILSGLLGGKGINPKPRKVAKSKKANGKNGVSAKRRLQGRYMGVVRNLPLAQKRAVSKIREKSGYHAAIREAKKIQAEIA